MYKRIAIFVDGSNFFSSMIQLNVRADFDKIVSYFNKSNEVVGCFYFTGLPPQGVESNLRRLVDRLSYNGWNIISKETKSYSDDNGTVIKGNMDVELTVQAWRMCEYITDLILFSGDGDFRSMVEYLQEKAVRVTAVSLHSHEGNSMMADTLRRQVNTFINLIDLAPHIAYEYSEQPVRTKQYLKPT